MFATLRQDKGSFSVEKMSDVGTHLACRTCRARKLKCTGERGGCQRCKSKLIECEYPNTSRGKGRPKKSGSSTAANNSTAGPRKCTSNPQTEDNSPEQSHTIDEHELSVTQDQDIFPLADVLTPSGLDFDDSLFIDVERLGKMESESYMWTDTTDWQASGLPGQQSPLIGTTNIIQTGPVLPTPPPTVADRVSQPTLGQQERARNDSVTSSVQSSLSDSTQSSTACQCTNTACCILEALEVENYRINLSSIARLLRIKKRALNWMPRALDCPRCSISSSFIMLDIIISQKLVSSYQRILDILTKRFMEVQRAKSNPSTIDTTMVDVNDDPDLTGGDGPGAQNLFLRDYEVDASEEPCVYGSLAGMQLETMERLLTRVMALVQNWHWDTHEKMVRTLQKEVRRQIKVCNTPVV